MKRDSKMSYSNSIITRRGRMVGTDKAIPGRESEMVVNNAGGYSFQVSSLDRLRRFLILGSDSDTYYASASKMTTDNISGVVNAFEMDGVNAVEEIAVISESGRAAKNDPALFALAMASSYGVNPNYKGASEDLIRLMRGGKFSNEVRRAAFEALPRVARTGTHIMQFANYMNNMRGWGRMPRAAVSDWFLNHSPEDLAYQAVKYRHRHGWSLRDIMRLSHPVHKNDEQGVVFDWIAHHHHGSHTEVDANASEKFSVIKAYIEATQAKSAEDIVGLIKIYGNKLPHECIPTEFLNDANVWSAMIRAGMPMTAMLRNLNRFAKHDVTSDPEIVKMIAERLTDENQLRKSRIHPFKILNALSVYKSGQGHMGDMRWKPVKTICDALDASFYASFKTFEPANRRFCLGLDISGSMAISRLNNSMLSARDGAAAMALITMASEANCFIGGFSNNFCKLNISPRLTIGEVINKTSNLPYSPTNPGSMITYALDNKIEADTFVLYTDNEAWGHYTHTSQLIERYREKTGINAKLIAVGMTATQFSVVDPEDHRQLNVVGFDTETPSMITEFSRW